MFVPQTLRHQQFDNLSKQFAAVVAEQALRLGIDLNNRAVLVDNDYRVGHRFQKRSLPIKRRDRRSVVDWRGVRADRHLAGNRRPGFARRPCVRDILNRAAQLAEDRLGLLQCQFLVRANGERGFSGRNTRIVHERTCWR